MPQTTSATWPDLAAGAKARASDVEAKFDWLEGDIWPQAGGSTTDGAFDLGGSGKSWRAAWVNSINPTTTAGGVAMFTTTVANSSVGFEIAGAKAFLVPRLTSAQRTGLTPINGMLVYDTDNVAFYVYENGAWIPMAGQKIGIRDKVAVSYAGFSTTTVISFSGSGRLIYGIIGASPIDTTTARFIIDSISSTFVVGNPSSDLSLVLQTGATTGTIGVTSTSQMAELFFQNQLVMYAVKGSVGPNTSTSYFAYEGS